MPPSIFFTTKCTKCQRKKTTCMCTDSLVGNLSPWSVTQTQVAQAKADALNWEKSVNDQGFISLLQRSCALFKMYFGITIMNLLFALLGLLMPLQERIPLMIVYLVIAAVFLVIALANNRPKARW